MAAGRWLLAFGGQLLAAGCCLPAAVEVDVVVGAAVAGVVCAIWLHHSGNILIESFL